MGRYSAKLDQCFKSYHKALKDKILKMFFGMWLKKIKEYQKIRLTKWRLAVNIKIGKFISWNQEEQVLFLHFAKIILPLYRIQILPRVCRCCFQWSAGSGILMQHSEKIFSIRIHPDCNLAFNRFFYRKRVLVFDTTAANPLTHFNTFNQAQHWKNQYSSE